MGGGEDEELRERKIFEFENLFLPPFSFPLN
jgi:hypothetical protein